MATAYEGYEALRRYQCMEKQAEDAYQTGTLTVDLKRKLREELEQIKDFALVELKNTWLPLKVQQLLEFLR